MLFVGTTLLGFSEREVGHWTYKKWNGMFGWFQRWHNFKANNNTFKLEPSEEEIMESNEWFKD